MPTALSEEECPRFHDHLHTLQLSLPMLTQRYIRVRAIATTRGEVESLRRLPDIDEYLRTVIGEMRDFPRFLILSTSDNVLKDERDKVTACRTLFLCVDCWLGNIEDGFDRVQKEDETQELE
jgi:hypothetical protein